MRGPCSTLVLLFAVPAAAVAGMPSVTLADIPKAAREVSQTGLTDLARQRLEVISFFLLGMLGCAWVIQRVWNSLRNDLAVLPRLSYGRAVGGLVLWGLLFVLVLTMISGARELMTPGAWEKQGLTYRLTPTPAPPSEDQITARFQAIERLRDWLLSYAASHGGYPPVDKPGVIPETLLQVPSAPGARYVYLGGRFARPDEDETADRHKPLAHEPEAVGPDRLVIRANGLILWLPETEIQRVLKGESP